MKLCFSADWHVSNFGPDQQGPITHRGADCLRVVDRLYAIPGVEKHFALGDIFNRDKPPPGLQRGVQDRISKDTYMLVGNHDQSSTEPSHHALAAMTAHATIVEDTLVVQCDDAEVGLVGFRQRDEVVSKLAQLQWGTSKYRIVGFHLGIADERTPEFLRNTRDSIGLNELVGVCKSYGVTHVFAGNWHNPEDWEMNGVKVCQVGGMIPQRFGDPFDTHGRVAVFDTETGETEFQCLAGPRYVTVTGEPPWKVSAPQGADPLWLRYLVYTDHKSLAHEHGRSLTNARNVRVDDFSRERSDDFGDLPTVSTAREVALKDAHSLGGTELVDYVQDCMTRATKD